VSPLEYTSPSWYRTAGTGAFGCDGSQDFREGTGVDSVTVYRAKPFYGAAPPDVLAGYYVCNSTVSGSWESPEIPLYELSGIENTADPGSAVVMKVGRPKREVGEVLPLGDDCYPPTSTIHLRQVNPPSARITRT
jgi:hypothetical protein